MRLLPTKLPRRELPAPPMRADLRVAIGLEEARLRPVWHDFGQIPHLIVFGDTETGKTNLLRLIGQGLTERFSPERGADHVRRLPPRAAGAVPQEYRLGYAVSETR